MTAVLSGTRGHLSAAATPGGHDGAAVRPGDDEVAEKLVVAYNRELAGGTEHLESATSIGFQYHLAEAQANAAGIQAQIADAQGRCGRISTGIAVASVIVAIAAVLVASIR